jgi:hypothetical protein
MGQDVYTVHDGRIWTSRCGNLVSSTRGPMGNVGKGKAPDTSRRSLRICAQANLSYTQ